MKYFRFKLLWEDKTHVRSHVDAFLLKRWHIVRLAHFHFLLLPITGLATGLVIGDLQRSMLKFSGYRVQHTCM